MDEARELRFRPTGRGRWLEAIIGSVWLLGWAAGEAFALVVLGGLVWAMVGGRELPNQPESPLAAALVVAFLLPWLAFWTLGGVLALRAWLGCFWAEDRLRLTSTDLEWQQRLGPWRKRRRLPRAEVETVRLARRGSSGFGVLIVQLADRQEELTRLGTPRQRQEAADLLERELAVHRTTPGRPAPAVLPGSWDCEAPSFGAELLVPCRRNRRIQTLVMAGLALPLATIQLIVLRQAWSNPMHLPLALLLAPLSAAACWGLIWLALGRQEWLLGSAELVAQRRFCGRVRPRFAARALMLEESLDDDGDAWYELRATQLHPLSGGDSRLPPSVVLSRRLHDPSEPRSLGRWLVRRTRIAFQDEIPDEAEKERRRRAETAQQLAQLDSSGRLGRWLAKRLRATGEAAGLVEDPPGMRPGLSGAAAIGAAPDRRTGPPER